MSVKNEKLKTYILKIAVWLDNETKRYLRVLARLRGRRDSLSSAAHQRFVCVKESVINTRLLIHPSVLNCCILKLSCRLSRLRSKLIRQCLLNAGRLLKWLGLGGLRLPGLIRELKCKRYLVKY